MTQTKQIPQDYVERGRSNKKRIVCMDVLNFGTTFLGLMTKKKKKLWRNEIIRGRKKVKAFVKAANRADIEIIGFIDKSVSTAEAIKKWKTRRKKELNAGKMLVIPDFSSLIGSLFKEQGITIHYSTIDCDDTIAAFAYRLGADVLSQDNDFFRYFTSSSEKRPPYNVFSMFHINKGVLKLIPHPNNCNKSISKREILSTLPATMSSPYFLEKPNQHLVDMSKCPSAWMNVSHQYIRGCGTNLPKIFENPHLAIRPLRQALYWHIGVERVMEVLAVWNDHTKEPEFQETVVMSDSRMANLLFKPAEAMEVLFKDQQKPKDCSEVEWRNQLFAQIVFTAGICSWCSGKPALTIIDELLAKKSLQGGEENQVPSVGMQASVKDVNQTSRTGIKKATQDKQGLPVRVQAPTEDGELVQPSQAGKENLAYTVDVQASLKDGEFKKTSQRGKKKAIQVGKENQTPTIGNQTPTKDWVGKQPSQAAKKKTLQAGRENQAHRVGIQAPIKDGKYKQPSQSGKKKSLKVGKNNQVVPVGEQAPTKDRNHLGQEKRRLLEASKAGDLELVKKFVNLHPHIVNCRDLDGRHCTPLHFAAGYNRVEVVEFLLNNGADVLAMDKGGIVPLHYACSNGHFEVNRLFVKHCRDSVGRNSTPLHLAPSFNNQAQTTTSCNKRWEAQTGTRSSYPWGCLARDSNNYNVN